MKQVILSIEGMHCSMCESHVIDQVRKSLPKAKKIKADHRKGEVTFLIEEGMDYTPAMNAISKEGYKILTHQITDYQKRGLFSFL